MGDVYNAMQRAGQEKTGHGPAADSQVTSDGLHLRLTVDQQALLDHPSPAQRLWPDQERGVLTGTGGVLPGAGRKPGGVHVQVTQANQLALARAVETTAPAPAPEAEEAQCGPGGPGGPELPGSPGGQPYVFVNTHLDQARSVKKRLLAISNDDLPRTLLGCADPQGTRLAQYRQIKQALLAKTTQRPAQTILITSPAHRQGTTVTALNLAVVLSELKDKRILIVQATPNQPTLSNYFDQPAKQTLVDLANQPAVHITQAINATQYANLCWLAASRPRVPFEQTFFDLPLWADWLDTLCKQFDHIVIDGPPALDQHAVALAAAQCDQTVIVLKHDQQQHRHVRLVTDQLLAAGTHIAGAILTHQ